MGWEEGKCFITGARANLDEREGVTHVYVQGADVTYAFPRWTEEEFQRPELEVTDTELARLMTWVIDQDRLGVVLPVLDGDRLRWARSLPGLTVLERMERLYLYLERRTGSIDGFLVVYSSIYDDEKSEMGRRQQANREGLMAWTESASMAQVERLLEYAVKDGKVAFDGQRASLTIPGWHHLEQRRRVGTAHDQAFVAMWFSEEMSRIYETGIAPAIQAVGFRPMVINRKEHNNKIDDEIVAEIRRSRFVVADFTCGTTRDGAGKIVAVPRGGVYYEAGFAKGLGLEVIWTVRADQINDVHFDTRQYNHITWKDADDLKSQLTNRIGAVLGPGPRKSTGLETG